MDKVNFIIKTVECTMGLGIETKWMDMGLYTTNQES